MYFAADVGGNVHLWRQRFPNGTPEQMTFGANEEQGIAVAPDGRSLITSVGKRLSAIWIHDAAGERAITSEGYASAPWMSADGTRVFFLDSANSPSFISAGPAPAGELRKPILIKLGASPDGEWVIAAVAVAAEGNLSSETVKVPMETVAIPVHGGVPRRVCGTVCSSIWSPDGRFFYVNLGGETRAMPVPAGKSLPDWPAAGLSADDKPDDRLGVRVILHGTVSAGADPSTYVFRKTELHANLFRIPLH